MALIKLISRRSGITLFNIRTTPLLANRIVYTEEDVQLYYRERMGEEFQVCENLSEVLQVNK